jgi:UDP-N-acetyl-D-mannosaminuronate dehydrogenase
VAVGTSAQFNAVHSPIRGVHPHLAEGICTFEKYFGGERAVEAADLFASLGINCITTDKAENTEAMKLWDTTYYGWNIVFEKAVHAYCEEHRLDFDIVYTHANRGYNSGYADLGMDNVQRPVLKHYPGKIGGHCVIPNAKLLGGEIADFILDSDEKY